MTCKYWFFLFWGVSSVSLLFMPCNQWFFFLVFELSHLYLYCLCHVISDFLAVSSVSLLFMACNYWFFIWAVSSVSLLLMTCSYWFFILSCFICVLVTPTKWSDAQPLVEREKQLECRPVEISRSLKGKEMLHVLYIMINISCPRKRIKNRGMLCNLLRVPTFMV